MQPEQSESPKPLQRFILNADGTQSPATGEHHAMMTEITYRTGYCYAHRLTVKPEDAEAMIAWILDFGGTVLFYASHL